MFSNKKVIPKIFSNENCIILRWRQTYTNICPIFPIISPKIKWPSPNKCIKSRVYDDAKKMLFIFLCNLTNLSQKWPLPYFVFILMDLFLLHTIFFFILKLSQSLMHLPRHLNELHINNNMAVLYFFSHGFTIKSRIGSLCLTL